VSYDITNNVRHTSSPSVICAQCQTDQPKFQIEATETLFNAETVPFSAINVLPYIHVRAYS
jgi:hypothetical protein